jgi:hypothetical protein
VGVLRGRAPMAGRTAAAIFWMASAWFPFVAFLRACTWALLPFCLILAVFVP